MLYYVQTPYSGAITYCLMMKEHVSFPGQDTLTQLLVKFTVKAHVGQLRVERTTKNIPVIQSLTESKYYIF